MDEHRFCFTELSSMHHCCTFPFALAGLFCSHCPGVCPYGLAVASSWVSGSVLAPTVPWSLCRCHRLLL